MDYTPDEDLLEFKDGDKSASVYGYVFAVETAKTVGKLTKYQLLKFVLTNGSKKLTCLLWGQDLIERYQKELTIDRKIFIEGGSLKECKTFIRDDAFIDLELNIQRHSELTFYGNHKHCAAVPSEIEEVDFTSLTNSPGIIRINGYVRTKFVQAFLRNNASTFGTGCITDGTYKLTVNITVFEENEIEKGTKVAVTGKLSFSPTGTVVLQVDSFKEIEIFEEEPKMPLSQLCRGVKTPRRKSAKDHEEE